MVGLDSVADLPRLGLERCYCAHFIVNSLEKLIEYTTWKLN